MILDELITIIEERKKNSTKDSYVASLFAKGKDHIVQKVGEESVEVVIAAKNESKQRVIEEFADLLFHSLVLLSCLGIHPKEILKELEKRHKK